MPRFYFNTRINDDIVVDPEGEHLRDHDHAWEVARAMVRQLLKTELSSASIVSAILEVTDENGEIVLEFPFSEAIIDSIEPGGTQH